jgi:hypothetical protein
LNWQRRTGYKQKEGEKEGKVIKGRKEGRL